MDSNWKKHLVNEALKLDGKAQCEIHNNDEPVVFDYTRIVDSVDGVIDMLELAITQSLREVHLCRHLDREGEAIKECLSEGIQRIESQLETLRSVSRQVDNSLKPVQ